MKKLTKPDKPKKVPVDPTIRAALNDKEFAVLGLLLPDLFSPGSRLYEVRGGWQVEGTDHVISTATYAGLRKRQLVIGGRATEAGHSLYLREMDRRRRAAA